MEVEYAAGVWSWCEDLVYGAVMCGLFEGVELVGWIL